jgi:hypothetical protein
MLVDEQETIELALSQLRDTAGPLVLHVRRIE